MPAAVPLPPIGEDYYGVAPAGMFWRSTDGITGSPIRGHHDMMEDTALTGASPASVAGASGNTHLYVATLVLFALGGIILFHIAGFRAMATASVGKG